MLEWMRPHSKIVVYLACPYTRGDVGENVCRANREWDTLFDLGLVPVNPLWSHYQHLSRPRTWDAWMAYNEEWVRRCDAVLRLSGESVGGDREVELARSLGRPVFYSREALAAWAFGRPHWVNETARRYVPGSLAICGLGRHGKGTAARYLADRYGFVYQQSTSEAAAELVFGALRDRYGYETVEQCWQDRAAHRDEWALVIDDHNRDDPAALYREMARKGNTILEGIRRRDELEACWGDVVEMSLWIDAGLRVGGEDQTCEIQPGDCDVVIDNNLDQWALREQLDLFAAEAGLARRSDDGPRPGQDQGGADGAVSDDSAAAGGPAGATS